MSNLETTLRVWMTETWRKLGRTKQLGLGTDVMETQLRRCLSTIDIILLGIGHMVGSGVYVLTSSVARNIAGPAIVLSFIISGFASFLSALCYAEFAGRFPKCGSAYSYAYLALGELWAFVVGWNMILENVIGTAAVSRACSAYIDSLLGGMIRNYTLASISSSIGLNSVSEHVDIFALIIVFTFVIFLTCGVKVTSYLNNLFSLVNIGVILIIIVVGFYFSDINNWKNNFMAYGWKGVFAGSATCFYAFIGFDSIASSGEEAKDPQRSIPLATFISMTFATISYVGVSAVLTLMVPYNEIVAESGLPDALGAHGAFWAKFVVIVGACCGMVTVLIGTMYSLTRIVYAMADDGLLFSWMGSVNQRTQIPLMAMYFFASLGACLALFLDITTLVEMMSIGTLIAYLVVSASVIVVRYQPLEESQAHSNQLNNQELNDLSVDSSISDEKQLIDELVATNEFDDEKKSTFFQPLKEYVSRELLILKIRQNAPESLVSICVILMAILIFVFCIAGMQLMQESSHQTFNLIIIGSTVVLILILLSIVSLHEQNVSSLRYKVPLVPLVPTLSMISNIALMINLQGLTWMRLLFWMIIGFLVYFLYGIKNSKIRTDPSLIQHINSDDIRKWGSLDDTCLPDNASTSSTY